MSPGRGLSRLPATPVDLASARLAAAAAAAVLLVASRGDLYAVAVLVGVAVWSVPSGAAVVLAAAATVARWGSPDLADVAGAQEVLGVAVAVGPVPAAAGSALAGAAFILAARPVVPGAWRLAAVVPCGLGFAALAAGPGPDGDVAARVGAAVAGAVAAVAVVAARSSSPRSGRIVDSAAVAAGLAAVVLAVLA